MKITIIGAGPGGYTFAKSAADAGFEVTVISDGDVAGTCLNSGCIPTKSLAKNAEIIETLKKSDLFGLKNLNYQFDFSKVMERKDEIVGRLRSGVEGLLDGDNIRLVRGKGIIMDAHTVEADGIRYESDYIVIATGSHSATLPIPGADLQGIMTSSEILKLKQLPETMCIIGAGVIGLEFASIFDSFGTKVTVLEYCKDVLPHFDTDMSKRLKQALSKRGINIETSASVREIRKADGGFDVLYEQKETKSVNSEVVLMAVGRRPSVHGAGIENAGVEYSEKGIFVNENMQTNIANIYAIGDVTGGLMLAHTAIFQGKVALAHIMKTCGMNEQEDLKINFDITPAAVFTYPEAASVGLSEDECKKRGIRIKVYKSFFRANGKAVSMDEPEGYCKIIAASGDDNHKEGLILGCHMFGVNSSDLIHEIAILMNGKHTVGDYRNVIHAHPTISEVLQSAIEK